MLSIFICAIAILSLRNLKVAASLKEEPSFAYLFYLAGSMVCIHPLLTAQIPLQPWVGVCASLFISGVGLDGWVEFGLVSSDQVVIKSAVTLISTLYLPQS